jgi:glycosyltransferase involved in cell wall biosynthesis
VERARRKFGIPALDAHFLPNPIPLPSFESIHFDTIPTFLVLGRIEPQKRPWIVAELARRIPAARFVVAGSTRFPELMADVLDSFRALPNVKYLGAVGSVERGELLRTCWGLLNVSAHEGYPVSFQEAFSYGKTVISNQDPDGVVTSYGYWAGPSEGDGLDEKTLSSLVSAIQLCIRGQDERLSKGYAAREYAVQTHSFERFDSEFRRILAEEQLI